MTSLNDETAGARDCPQCGASIRSDARFCPTCGARLPAADAATVVLPRAEPPPADRGLSKTAPVAAPDAGALRSADATLPPQPQPQAGTNAAAGSAPRRSLIVALLAGVGLLFLVCVAAALIGLRFIRGFGIAIGGGASGPTITGGTGAGFQTTAALGDATAAATEAALQPTESPANETSSQSTAMALEAAREGLGAASATQESAAARATAESQPPTAVAPEPTQPPAPTAVPAKLRFAKLNENDDAGCVSVQIRGISTRGWTFRIDGKRLSGNFDAAGNARLCGLAPRQEATFTVFDAQRRPVPGGSGVPTRGSAIMQATWR